MRQSKLLEIFLCATVLFEYFEVINRIKSAKRIEELNKTKFL